MVRERRLLFLVHTLQQLTLCCFKVGPPPSRQQQRTVRRKPGITSTASKTRSVRTFVDIHTTLPSCDNGCTATGDTVMRKKWYNSYPNVAPFPLRPRLALCRLREHTEGTRVVGLTTRGTKRNASLSTSHLVMEQATRSLMIGKPASLPLDKRAGSALDVVARPNE